MANQDLSPDPGKTRSDAPGAEPGSAPHGPVPPPSRFAVPESIEERRKSMAPRIIVPEVAVENEEDLLKIPAGGGKVETPAQDRFENWFILLLFLAGSLAIILTGRNGNVGMAWDEAYYVDAAQKTNVWLAKWLSGEGSVTKGAPLAACWDAYNVEPRGHPSITRFLVGLGMWLSPAKGSPLDAMRMPIAFCYGLTLVVIYLLTRLCYGRVTAWLTVLAYFLLPRVFGHAHFALTETPTVLVTVLVVYAFLRGLKSGPWALWTGVLFGLALATKINALVLPLILLPWAFLFYRRESARNLYAMLFIGPAVMALLWPWMWENAPLHFAEYLKWNFQHKQIGVFYGGRVYNSLQDPVPWHYAWKMTVFTIPPVTLALVVLGIARTLRAPKKHNAGLLFLWAAAVPMLALMMKGAPKYDGVRLFLSAFPFLAALAGIGGGVLVRMGAFYDRAGERFPKGRIVLIALILALTVGGGHALLSCQPYYLSYYNSLIKGTQGAAGKMEVTYWGEALNQKALDTINDAVPDGATLAPRALNIEVLRYYQTWGLLKKGIQLVEDRPAQYHLLQYRQGMFGLPDQMLFGEYEKLRIARFPQQGVPLLGLYQTGPEFVEDYMRRKQR